MIYISSSCIKTKRIRESVEVLSQNGYKFIELSGGTDYYDRIEEDLLDLKHQYKLDYSCHNYFPPPREHFFLNIASIDDVIYGKSLTYLKNAINFSKRIGASSFSFHAGFMIDLGTSEIGSKISYRRPVKKKQAVERFIEGYSVLQKEAEGLKLYIENNVLSQTNWKTFKKFNPLLLTTYSDYIELKALMDFNLILDVAHLKVSCNALSLDFSKELKRFIEKTDCLHISDNNGLSDQNKPIKKGGKIIMELKKYNLRNKNFTLEVYDSLKNIQKSYELLHKAAGPQPRFGKEKRIGQFPKESHPKG